MITAVDTRTIQTYTPKMELCEPPDKRTTFQIQYPDLSMMEKSENESRRSELKGTKSVDVQTAGTQKRTLLEQCLKGWHNFVDEDGKQIPFNKDKMEEMLSLIPPAVRDELYGALTGNNRLLEHLEEDARQKGIWQPPSKPKAAEEPEEVAVAS